MNENEFERPEVPEDVPQNTDIISDGIAAEQAKKIESQSKLRFAANRIGWATSALVGVWIAMLAFVTVILGMMGGVGEAIYNKYLLIINEVTLGLAIAVAVTVLLSVRRVNLHKNDVSAKYFLSFLVMCSGTAYVFNLIGSAGLAVWNLLTNNSVGGELAELLYDMDPLIMFLSVGVLAPILEELFFRKLLTDRLRVFGELPAILLPAFLFALFHQSASQFLYAFALGILLGYFYCRTGNYWLTVAVHAIFNTVSGVIPVLFLPALNAFLVEFEAWAQMAETADVDAWAEMLMPILEQYGAALGLYMLYALVIFVVNVTGIILVAVKFKKFRERKGEHSLPFKESAKTVFKTPGVIFCTVLLGIMTVISLFS